MSTQPFEKLVNNFSTTLASSCTSGATSISVSGTSSSFVAGYNYRFIIDSEIVVVTGGITGTTWTVTRAQDGTTAAAHSAGASVVQIISRDGFQELIASGIGSADNRGQDLYVCYAHQSSDERVYAFGSVDGINWQYLKKEPCLIPGSGNQRDPSYIRWKDAHYVAHTNSTNTYFTILRSYDKRTWTSLVNVDCSAIASINLVWAPCFFIDPPTGNLYVFVTVSTGGSTTNFQVYYLTPTNAALTTWSTPTQISGTGLPADMIDAYVVYKSGTYHLWYKEDLTNKVIEYASSSSLTTGYTVTQSGNWAGWGTNNEAPCLQKIDSSTWRIWFNNVSGLNSVATYYSDSTDDWATWSSKVAVTAPFILAHADVTRVQDFPTARNMLAAHLSDMMTKGAFYTQTNAQSISNNTTTILTLSSATVTSPPGDQLSAYDGGANGKLTAPSSGWYTLYGHVKFADSTGGKRVLDCRVNGTTFVGSNSMSADANNQGPDLNITSRYWMARGDYFELTVYQNQGGSVNVTGFHMALLRDP